MEESSGRKRDPEIPPTASPKWVVVRYGGSQSNLKGTPGNSHQKASMPLIKYGPNSSAENGDRGVEGAGQ